MTTETIDVAAANRELGRRFFEAQDRRQGGLDPALCADTYQAFLGGNPAMDRAAHDGFGQAFYAAFPGMTHTVEDVFATGDRVALRFSLRGTHQAPFFGIPATGRPVHVVAHILMRVADGKVTTLMGVFDEAGLLRQLGILP